jgi:hypothetical protein
VDTVGTVLKMVWAWNNVEITQDQVTGKVRGQKVWQVEQWAENLHPPKMPCSL